MIKYVPYIFLKAIGISILFNSILDFVHCTWQPAQKGEANHTVLRSFRKKLNFSQLNICISISSKVFFLADADVQRFQSIVYWWSLPLLHVVLCWTSRFVILWFSGLFCHFYSIFDGKSCWRTM